MQNLQLAGTDHLISSLGSYTTVAPTAHQGNVFKASKTWYRILWMIAKLICFEVKGTYGAPEEVTYTDKNIVASVL